MIDSGWYRDITDFAQSTPWLAEPVILFTEYGIFALGLAVAALLWWARRQGSAVLASVLWVPIAMVAAFVVNSLLKQVVAEPRPCRVVPGVHTVLPCDGPTDYAFPSNHTVVFAAFAAAVFLVNRRWGLVAGVVTILMAASRLYVGAHYPHDVVVGLVVGLAIGACGLFIHRPLTAVLDRLVFSRRATQEPPAGADIPPVPLRPGPHS
jgi:membrane-associated phospholipid phosphatase